jgi:hypothetical protein
MSRPLSLLPALLLIALALPSLARAQAQDSLRIIALIVTSGETPGRADQISQSLTRIEAETLRVTDPSNSALRAQMRRFAKEAEQSDAALIFVDMPMVSFEDRSFVLPTGAKLNRPTDLFTQAVPLRAFSRITALSERGGAVVVTGAVPSGALPQGVSPTSAAPAPLPGLSEIVFVPQTQADPLLQSFDTLIGNPVRVDLASLLPALAGAEGATLSAPPPAPIVLKAPIKVKPPVKPASAATAPAPDPTPVTPVKPAAEIAPPSIEDLEILEKSLSPAIIRRLQRKLRKLGHYQGLIDGIAGKQTRSAITAFQAQRNEKETGFLTPGQLSDLLAQT